MDLHQNNPLKGSLPLLSVSSKTTEIYTHVTRRDIAQMVARCIEAPEDLMYDIFYAVSNNKWSYRDIEHARQVVGYIPQDSAEDYR